VRRRLVVTGLVLVVGVVPALAVSGGPAGAVRPQAQVVEGLFDVGGYRLYLRCTGQGSPTVVMDASLGADSTTWSQVEPLLARYTRVCVYDRAGLGRSDPAPVPRTTQEMVDDLTTLLRVAGVPGPYVLVGHSIGGFNVQLLARQDGGRTVVGVVLVDATPPQFPAVVESVGGPIPSPDENPEGLDIRAGAAQVLAAPPFPPVPLVVLTHGVPILPPPLEGPWQQLQAAQSQLSPFGRLIVARGAGHFIQDDQPRLVVRAIVEVVALARRDPARHRGFTAAA
jgi:pimeloyl-ACP methyl ester carboxylesterase